MNLYVGNVVIASAAAVVSRIVQVDSGLWTLAACWSAGRYSRYKDESCCCESEEDCTVWSHLLLLLYANY